MFLAQLLEAFTVAEDSSSVYNILAIDGGGAKGLIPAVILKEMENYAYWYAFNNTWLDNLPPNKAKFVNYNHGEEALHLSLLFDMAAGTSTGSIIAGALNMPTEHSLHKDHANQHFISK